MAPVMMPGPVRAITIALLFLAGRQIGVPVTEEPRHKVVFANRYVRVIDAALPVGDTTLFHTHDLDNVPVVIAGGTIRTEVIAGSTTETTLEVGRAWFAKAAYTHQIANIGSTPLRFIDAEILARWNGPPPDPRPLDLPHEATIVENDIVRLASITLAPQETLVEHTHLRPFLQVEVSGGSVQQLPRAAGSFSWFDAGKRHPLQNTGDRPYETVIVEWK
jgi:quercetin dioxygenase-like cupin family protein